MDRCIVLIIRSSCWVVTSRVEVGSPINSKSVFVEFHYRTSTKVSSNKEQPGRILLIWVQETSYLLVHPNLAGIYIQLGVGVVPYNLVLRRIVVGILGIIDLQNLHDIVHNECDVVVRRLTLSTNLMVDTIKYSEPRLIGSVRADESEIKEFANGAILKIQFHYHRDVISHTEGNQVIIAVQVATIDCLQGKGDVVEESTPFPVAIEIDGISDAVIIGWYKCVGGRVSSNYNLIVYFIVDNTGWSIVFLTTNCHREEPIFTFLSHERVVETHDL